MEQKMKCGLILVKRATTGGMGGWVQKTEMTLFMDGPIGFMQNILKLGSILAMMKMALDTSRVGFCEIYIKTHILCGRQILGIIFVFHIQNQHRRLP